MCAVSYCLTAVDAKAVPIVAGQVGLVPYCLVEAIDNSNFGFVDK